LAILFPKTQFHLVDSIGKKIKVATAVSEAIGLQNTTFAQCRCRVGTDNLPNGTINTGFDFVVSRAVMPLPDLCAVSARTILPNGRNALPNGVICLKGGDLTAELAPFRKTATTLHLRDEFTEEYFKTKQVIHIPL
jgi:16S rRNA (guanine527-N7)-methyltransferase